ncbi:MAG: hypothetical protein KAY37_05795 [Phycisphaerae bacterium]|nr:hypothetical protein [Phycisphaerae bacterium]
MGAPSLPGAGDGIDPRDGPGIQVRPPPSERVGHPPVELSFLSVNMRTPYVVDYPGEDGGKTAHYVLRWVATTSEK